MAGGISWLDGVFPHMVLCRGDNCVRELTKLRDFKNTDCVYRLDAPHSGAKGCTAGSDKRFPYPMVLCLPHRCCWQHSSRSFSSFILGLCETSRRQNRHCRDCAGVGFRHGAAARKACRKVWADWAYALRLHPLAGDGCLDRFNGCIFTWVEIQGCLAVNFPGGTIIRGDCHCAVSVGLGWRCHRWRWAGGAHRYRPLASPWRGSVVACFRFFSDQSSSTHRSRPPRQ